MLPTNQKTKKGLLGISCTKNKELFLMERSDSNGELGFWSKDGNMYSTDPQHLYFISEERVKISDYYLTQDNRIVQWNKDLEDAILNHQQMFNELPKSATQRIIIATTDNDISLNLGLEKHEGSSKQGDMIYTRLCPFPQPSKSFIDKFIVMYNKNTPITDVLIEYTKERYILNIEDRKTRIGTEYKEIEYDWMEELKVNNNNEITIKRCKESWSREEVIELFIKYQYDVAQHILKNESFESKPIPVEWIKQNL